MSDHHEIFTQFFLNHEVFLRSHTMFIITSTKEFTLVNIALSNHGIAIEHLVQSFRSNRDGDVGQ